MAFNGINTGDFNADGSQDLLETPEHDRDSGDAPLPCSGFTGNVKRIGTFYIPNGFRDGSLGLQQMNRTQTFTRLVHPYDENFDAGFRMFDTNAWIPTGYRGAPGFIGFTYNGDPAFSPQYDMPIDWDGLVVPRVMPVVANPNFAALNWNQSGVITWRINNGFRGGNPGYQCAGANGVGFEGMTSPFTSGTSFTGIDGGANAMVAGDPGGAGIAWAFGAVGTVNMLSLGQGQFQAAKADYYLVAEWVIDSNSGSSKPKVIWEGYLDVGEVVSVGLPPLRGFTDADYQNPNGSPKFPAPIGRFRSVLQSCNAYSFLHQNPTAGQA